MMEEGLGGIYARVVASQALLTIVTGDAPDLERCKTLITVAKADVNVQDQHMNSLLHWLAWLSLHDIMQFVLDLNQVDVNARNDHGETPLHW